LEKITLSNGFRIMLEKVDWVKSCSMGVWIASGSRFETPEKSGISHFIEHMVFKGTKTRSAMDIALQMDEIGGSLNAYTSKEYTCVYARSLTDHVGRAFDIIGDMLTQPKLEQKDIEIEKNVIAEEIAMYEDSPEDLCMDILYEGVWPDDMLGKNILGSRQTVKAVTEASLREQMAESYVPERMVASFCGNFDKDMAISACESFFGSMKATGSRIEASAPVYSSYTGALKKDFEQTQIIFGFPGISSADERRHAAHLAVSILGGENSSRLFQKLREELGIVYSVDAFNLPYLGTGLAGISLALSPKSEKRAFREALKIMREFPESLSENELARAKEHAAASLVMGLESTAARAIRMGQNELLHNKVIAEEELIKSIRGVTLEHARNVAADLLDFNSLSLSVVGRIHKNKNYDELVRDTIDML
jgi:predicted Zn-dependent peptidase